MKIKLQCGLCLILRRFDEDVRRVSKGDLASTFSQYPNRGELPRIVLHGGGERGGVVLYSGEAILCAVVALFEFLNGNPETKRCRISISAKDWTLNLKP